MMKTYIITYNVKGGYQGIELTIRANGLKGLVQYALDNIFKGIELVSVKQVK